MVTIYYLTPVKFRWVPLIIASFVFYSFYNPVYSLILIAVIIINYFAGIYIEAFNNKPQKITVLVIAIVANLGILLFFKYYNFFNDTISNLSNLFNIPNNLPYLNIILPIGLSFYIFQALSYIIDVHRNNQIAEKNFGVFALYLSFFPKLTMGPIERASDLIHQFKEKHYLKYENITAGLKLMLWGFFQKIVIADRIAMYVDPIFDNAHDFSGTRLIAASVFFSFQLYADFAGYTNIALGAAKILGINLTDNFDSPFFSKTISEFWRRWHITLSSWVYTYLYNPILINKRDWGTSGIVYALVVSFVLCGLWHGASWNFVIFGFLHGCALAYEVLTKKKRKKISARIPAGFYNTLSILLTFSFFTFTGIFFKSIDLDTAFHIIKHLFVFNTGEIFQIGFFKDGFYDIQRTDIMLALLAIGVLIAVDYLKQKNGNLLTYISEKPLAIRWSIYYCLLFGIFELGVHNYNRFIYFQF